jgi:hypothetical protein
MCMLVLSRARVIEPMHSMHAANEEVVHPAYYAPA